MAPTQRFRSLVRGSVVTVDGAELRVPPGVLDPVWFRSGAWFARRVAMRAEPGRRVLDLGCGSGIVGVLAQRAGAEVVAVDIDQRACAAASSNGLRDVRQGDLFRPVAGERFDLVCMNPPYLRGPRLPVPWARAIWGGRSLQIVHRFVREASAHLEPGGQAMMVLSSLGPEAISLAREAGWELAEREQQGGEELSLWIAGG